MRNEPGGGPQGGPGASGPGEPGYEGRVAVGEEGAATRPAPPGMPKERPEDAAVSEDQLDDISAESFPASDPPSYSSPVDTVGSRDEDA